MTPDNATSPMDSSNTQQIPRSMVNDLDHSQDPDTTATIPASLIEANDDHHLASAQPTKRLEVDHQPQQTKPMARPQAKPMTIPMPVPSNRPATKPMPVARHPEPVENEPTDQEVSGLIPTTTQSRGRSNLSRRLDGI